MALVHCMAGGEKSLNTGAGGTIHERIQPRIPEHIVTSLDAENNNVFIYRDKFLKNDFVEIIMDNSPGDSPPANQQPQVWHP